MPSTSTSNPSSSDTMERVLVHPTRDIPWTAKVVHLLPQRLMNTPDAISSAVSATSCGPWHCVASKSSNTHSLSLHVWYSTPSDVSLEEQKRSKSVMTIHHPKLNVVDGDNPVLLGMQLSTQGVYLYAANPQSGVMLLWNLTPDDFEKALAPPHSAIVFLDMDRTGDEELTCLTTTSAAVVMGTSHGRLFWIRQTQIPISLQAQEIPKPQSGLLSRLWGSSSSPSKGSTVTELCIAGSDGLWVISESGSMTFYTVTRVKANVSLEASSEFDLLPALRNKLAGEAIHSLEVASAAHCEDGIYALVLTQHPNRETRFYWVRVSAKEELVVETATWLNRFVAPEDIRVRGTIVFDEGAAYAVFEQPEGLPLIFMALDTKGTVLEMDIPKVQVGELLTVVEDSVTYGLFVVTSVGFGVRVRHQLHHPASPAAATSTGSTMTNRSTLQTMISHLRSAFWDAYQNPSRSIQLPPSLTTAAAGDVETAVLAFADQLLQKDNKDQAHRPLQWHLALINLLQRAGMYRSLSDQCRWKLMAAGQQAAVFERLSGQRAKTGWEKEWLDQLEADGVADWLHGVQETVLKFGAGEDRRERFLEWLCLALTAAAKFREVRLSSLYDVSSRDPPASLSEQDVPVWTSHPTMLILLRRQMDHWKDNAGSKHPGKVEVVAEGALVSFGDVYMSCATQENARKYTEMQEDAIALVRRDNGTDNDPLAFRLSREHLYFTGLCQIALDHDRKADQGEFSLHPLFEQIGEEVGAATPMSFRPFVLEWHCNRGLFGQVFKYGEDCKEALELLLENNEKMRPHKWIHAVREGHFDEATVSLMANAEHKSSRLPVVKQSLDMASLCNTVVEKDSPTSRGVAKRRRIDIDKRRELVSAQEALLGNQAAKTRLHSADKLLNFATTKFDEAGTLEEKVHACFIALAICSSYGSNDEIQRKAVSVWSLAIEYDARKEGPLWQQISGSEQTLTEVSSAKGLQGATVFGGLVERCHDVDGWKNITYDALEADVYQRMLGFTEGVMTELRRVLRFIVDAAMKESDEDDEVEEMMAD